MDIKLIADRIKYARSLRDLTLDEIADEIGVAKSTVQRYEKGLIASPKLPVLQAIAKTLDVSPMWLCGKTDLIDCKEEQTNEHYYFNEDARELAEFMFKNPEYKVLFDASRKVKKEDIEFVKQFMDRMRGDIDDTGC